MGDAIYRKKPIVNASQACTHCHGVGVVRAHAGSPEVMLCPRCGGCGVEPTAVGDLVLWPQAEEADSVPAVTPAGRSDALRQCRYARHNGAGIVGASGEIDLQNVHLLGEMLDQAVGDSQTVIVDLAGVSHIDSTGLNVLIRLHERCARRKTNLAVVFTSPNLWRIFSVLSLQDMFHIFPTVDAALRALSHSEGPPPPSRGRRARISIDNRD